MKLLYIACLAISAAWIVRTDAQILGVEDLRDVCLTWFITTQKREPSWEELQKVMENYISVRGINMKAETVRAYMSQTAVTAGSSSAALSNAVQALSAQQANNNINAALVNQRASSFAVRAGSAGVNTNMAQTIGTTANTATASVIQNLNVVPASTNRPAVVLAVRPAVATSTNAVAIRQVLAKVRMGEYARLNGQIYRRTANGFERVVTQTNGVAPIAVANTSSVQARLDAKERMTLQKLRLIRAQNRAPIRTAVATGVPINTAQLRYVQQTATTINNTPAIVPLNTANQIGAAQQSIMTSIDNSGNTVPSSSSIDIIRQQTRQTNNMPQPSLSPETQVQMTQQTQSIAANDAIVPVQENSVAASQINLRAHIEQSRQAPITANGSKIVSMHVNSFTTNNDVASMTNLQQVAPAEVDTVAINATPSSEAALTSIQTRMHVHKSFPNQRAIAIKAVKVTSTNNDVALPVNGEVRTEENTVVNNFQSQQSESSPIEVNAMATNESEATVTKVQPQVSKRTVAMRTVKLRATNNNVEVPVNDKVEIENAPSSNSFISVEKYQTKNRIAGSPMEFVSEHQENILPASGSESTVVKTEYQSNKNIAGAPIAVTSEQQKVQADVNITRVVAESPAVKEEYQTHKKIAGESIALIARHQESKMDTPSVDKSQSSIAVAEYQSNHKIAGSPMELNSRRLEVETEQNMGQVGAESISVKEEHQANSNINDKSIELTSTQQKNEAQVNAPSLGNAESTVAKAEYHTENKIAGEKTEVVSKHHEEKAQVNVGQGVSESTTVKAEYQANNNITGKSVELNAHHEESQHVAEQTDKANIDVASTQLNARHEETKVETKEAAAGVSDTSAKQVEITKQSESTPAVAVSAAQVTIHRHEEVAPAISNTTIKKSDTENHVSGSVNMSAAQITVRKAETQENAGAAIQMNAIKRKVETASSAGIQQTNLKTTVKKTTTTVTAPTVITSGAVAYRATRSETST